jgi:hypothetical protein
MSLRVAKFLGARTDTFDPAMIDIAEEAIREAPFRLRPNPA